MKLFTLNSTIICGKLFSAPATEHKERSPLKKKQFRSFLAFLYQSLAFEDETGAKIREEKPRER